MTVLKYLQKPTVFITYLLLLTPSEWRRWVSSCLAHPVQLLLLIMMMRMMSLVVVSGSYSRRVEWIGQQLHVRNVLHDRRMSFLERFDRLVGHRRMHGIYTPCVCSLQNHTTPRILVYLIKNKSYRSNGTNWYWPAVQRRPLDCRRARPGGGRPPTRPAVGAPARRHSYRPRQTTMTDARLLVCPYTMCRRASNE